MDLRQCQSCTRRRRLDEALSATACAAPDMAMGGTVKQAHPDSGDRCQQHRLTAMHLVQDLAQLWSLTAGCAGRFLLVTHFPELSAPPHTTLCKGSCCVRCAAAPHLSICPPIPAAVHLPVGGPCCGCTGNARVLQARAAAALQPCCRYLWQLRASAVGRAAPAGLALCRRRDPPGSLHVKHAVWVQAGGFWVPGVGALAQFQPMAQQEDGSGQGHMNLPWLCTALAEPAGAALPG